MSGSPVIDPAIALGQIEAADPSFNLELFKRQAVETFMAVKQSVAERDLAPVMDMVADSVYEELRHDIAGLLDRGATPDGPMVPSRIQVVAAERGPQGDAITLRMSAAPIQYVAAAGQEVDVGPNCTDHPPSSGRSAGLPACSRRHCNVQSAPSVVPH